MYAWRNTISRILSLVRNVTQPTAPSSGVLERSAKILTLVGRWLSLLSLVGGCGRIYFDPATGVATGADARLDSGTVVHPAPPRVVVLGDLGNGSSHNMFDALLTANATSVQFAPNPILMPSALDPYDVVIVMSLPDPLLSAEQTVIESFVAGGGGLIALTGFGQSASEDQIFTSVTSPFGTSAAGFIFLDSAVFLPHPVTAGLAPVVYDGGFELTTAPGTTIAEVSGIAVGAAVQHGAGRAVMWGDEWIMFDDDWTASGPLWTNIINWLWPTQ